MMFVITVLVLQIKQDIKTAQGSNGKPENIDQAERFVLKQKTYGGFEIAYYHILMITLIKFMISPISNSRSFRFHPNCYCPLLRKSPPDKLFTLNANFL
jgi:hypothetical protein